MWRSFRDVPANGQGAHARSSSRFSLTILEVACNPGISVFALTERKPPDQWRWALVGAEGAVEFEGCEQTEADAKRAAVDTMRQVKIRIRSEAS